MKKIVICLRNSIGVVLFMVGILAGVWGLFLMSGSIYYGFKQGYGDAVGLGIVFSIVYLAASFWSFVIGYFASDRSFKQVLLRIMKRA